MSSNSEELPEYQIFHILKGGEQESIGPFSQHQLVEMLNNREVRRTDLVYYPELPDWPPISEVFDFYQGISNFGEEGQDREVVSDTFAYVDRRSEPNEEFYYIAVQNFPAHSLSAKVKLRSPKSIVLSIWRICIVSHKLMGDTELHDYTLDQIERTELYFDDGDDDGRFEIVPKYGDPESVSKITVAQLKRLEEISGELLADEADGEAQEPEA